MKTQEELRKRVRDLMERYGTTQQFIATNIGVTRATINLWLHEKRELATPLVEKMERFLEERI